MKIKRTRSCFGFTLVELIAVIGIISTLLAIALPAFQVVREAARRTSCSSNLSQCMMAVMSYETTGRGLPPAADREGQSFYVRTLEYLDELGISEQARQGLAVGETRVHRMKTLSDFSLPVLVCPSHMIGDELPTIAIQGSHVSHYLGVAGPVGDAKYDGNAYYYKVLNPSSASGFIGLQGTFSPESNGRYRPLGLQDILDGTSNTFAIGEASASPPNAGGMPYRRAGWSFGAHFELGVVQKCYSAKSIEVGINEAGGSLNSQSFASNHSRGTQFAFVDGSIHFVDERISKDILKIYSSVDAAESLVSLENY